MYTVQRVHCTLYSNVSQKATNNYTKHAALICIPSSEILLTSNTSSPTLNKPVLSASPPGSSLEMKIPGFFSIPASVT